jgi:flagellar biosynthetic protein FliQ
VWLVELAQQALVLALVLSLPTLIASLVAGAFSAVTAAAARIHDPAIAVLPRQLAVGAALVAFGGGGASLLLRFTRALWSSIPSLVP